MGEIEERWRDAEWHLNQGPATRISVTVPRDEFEPSMTDGAEAYGDWNHTSPKTYSGDLILLKNRSTGETYEGESARAKVREWDEKINQNPGSDSYYQMVGPIDQATILIKVSLGGDDTEWEATYNLDA